MRPTGPQSLVGLTPTDTNKRAKNLEVEAQTNLEAHGTLVAEVVETHLIIYRRFNRYEMIQVETISQFNGYHHIVAALGVVNKLTTGANKDTILHEVITPHQGRRKIVDSIGMIVTQISTQHKLVGQKGTNRQIGSEAELLRGAVR